MILHEWNTTILEVLIDVITVACDRPWQGYQRPRASYDFHANVNHGQRKGRLCVDEHLRCICRVGIRVGKGILLAPLYLKVVGVRVRPRYSQPVLRFMYKCGARRCVHDCGGVAAGGTIFGCCGASET